MVFSSIGFIFVFYPLFLLSYYMLQKQQRNVWLFAGSMLFYVLGAMERPLDAGLFLISIICNYVFGCLIEKSENRSSLFLGIAANLCYLCYFKYILQRIPIGISFYTFQAISYLLDVANKKCPAEKNFVNFGTYLSMFPQLIAGPIVQYSEVSRQLQKRNISLRQFVLGLQIFVLGLGSKVLLANQIGSLWNQLAVIGYDSISTPLAWLGLFAYTFQIYFDFWGYSMMAIGLGRTLGFVLPKNFDNPYRAVSMTEFWRRWHMTLGAWFREYVYIPLGGNRKGRLRTYGNLFLVWLLTGIWHGGSWNFTLWGILLFVLIAFEKMGLKRVFEKYRFLGHLYMAAVIPLSWAVFAHSNWQQMLLFFKRLFAIGAAGEVVYAGDYIKYGREYGLCFFFCLLFLTKIPQKIWKRLQYMYVGQVILTGIFAGAVYCLYQGLDNPFLYYQF